MDSDDCDSDISSDSDGDNDEIFHKTNKIASPHTFYRFVRRLNGRYSSEKMHNEDVYREKFIAEYCDAKMSPTWHDLIEDSDEEQQPEIQSPTMIETTTTEDHFNIDEIRQKTKEFDRQQIKTIQLANADSNNPKILNNVTVTSSTCVIM